MRNSLVGSNVYSEDTLENSRHFKWTSIGNLVCLALTYSSEPSLFHVFNQLDEYPVTIFNFTAMALVIGMTYMFMDLFIKQYTGRLSWNEQLSPLLKGITLPSILQSSLLCLLHVRYAGDGARYLASSFATTPIWAVCPAQYNTSSTCVDSRDVLQHCQNQTSKKRLALNMTSVHFNYMTDITSNARGTLTWRFFVSAVIWILNFCLTTIPDTIVLKFYKYVVAWKAGSSVLTCVFIAVSTGRTVESFLKLMDISAESSIIHAVVHVALIFGIGTTGVYDFGMTSPFTMVDNAIIIFTICFIILCLIRSSIVNMLVLQLNHCVDIDLNHPKDWHYILFVIIPLATEFLYSQKLINIYFFLHLILSLLSCLMFYTLTVTRLFHSEFPGIKIIYIEGLLCLLGFVLSLPIVVVDKYIVELQIGLLNGLTTAVLYLGGLRMAIIMWVYGIEKFSTDINFWLGFTPTKFWVLGWTVVPALLLIGCGYRFFLVQKMTNLSYTVAMTWFLLSALIAVGFQIRTVVRYVMQNNLMGAFRSSKKYGPPDPRDRRRRRRFNDTIDHRECFHDCIPVDEELDCNHLPLMNTAEPTSDGSDNSLMQMYENAPSKDPSTITLVDTKTAVKDKDKQA